jgi:hypothetical protein
MVTNTRHHIAERHSKLWRGWSYIMTHKWPGITLRNIKKVPIYLFGEVNQRVKSILERHFVNYEAPAVYPEHVISGILHPQRCEVLLQNMIISQRTSLVKSMIEVMKIPLDFYEDLLFVQERLAIYYVGKISAALLRPTRHQVVSAIQDTPMIYNWRPASDTAASGIV